MADITTDRARATLGRQIRRGVSWNAANLLVNKGMSILVRLLLARLLVPEHFGLIAMVVVLLGLVKIFVDFGLSNALIQRKRDENSLIRYDSAFWFLLGGGIGWTTLFIIAGIPLMIWFYDEPQLRDLALVMSVSILLHSLSILPSVRLTRRMRFKSQVVAEVVSTVAASVVAIGLAFAGVGVWALAAQQLSSVGLKTAILWHAASWRPRRRYSWASLRDVVGFSGWMLGSQVVHYGRTNVDNLAVGVILGASSLGLYSMAYFITETVRVQVSGVIAQVMLPVYSRLQSNHSEIVLRYFGVTQVMNLVVFPISCFIILYSEDFILSLLGVKWAEAALPAKILAVAALFYSATGPSAEVLMGIGRASTLFRITATNLVLITIPTVLFLTYQIGISGTALGMVLGYISVRLRTYGALRAILLLPARKLLKSAYPATFVSAVIFAVEWWFRIDWVTMLVLLMLYYVALVTAGIKYSRDLQ